MIYESLVRDGLEELADAQLQHRLWTGSMEGLMSSFVECVEQIFDDSGLSAALDRGLVFGEEADDDLRRLASLVARVDARQDVVSLLQDPHVAACRRQAQRVLERWPKGRATVAV